MRKNALGRRLFSRQFKIEAVRRVLGGERIGSVARDLGIRADLLWGWKKRVEEQGEEYLYDVGRRAGAAGRTPRVDQRQRVAELERELGRKEMENRFLEKALRRVEELRQGKNDGGAAGSSKR